MRKKQIVWTCDLCGEDMRRDTDTILNQYRVKVYETGALAPRRKLDICAHCMAEIVRASKKERGEK